MTAQAPAPSINTGIAPFKHTRSGRAVHLLAPTPAMIDFEHDVIPVLAQIPRWGGHVGGYSVAQHSVLGARALLETGRPDAAPLFLLHDAHEAYLGDITTPVAVAFAVMAGNHAAEACEAAGLPYIDAIAARTSLSARHAIKRLKAGFDHAIFAAANLPEPTAEVRATVAAMDAAMLESEKRQLLPPCQGPWDNRAEPAPLRGGIRPWSTAIAEDQFRSLFRQLLPNARVAPPWRAAPHIAPDQPPARLRASRAGAQEDPR